MLFRSYPHNAIEFVLKFSNLKLSEVDQIVFFEKPFLKFERLLETYVAFAPKGFVSFAKAMPLWIKEKLFQKNLLFNKLKKHDENYKSDKNISSLEAFSFGFLVDLISDSYFGLNAIIYCSTTYFINQNANSFKLFSYLQMCLFFGLSSSAYVGFSQFPGTIYKYLTW